MPCMLWASGEGRLGTCGDRRLGEVDEASGASSPRQAGILGAAGLPGGYQGKGQAGREGTASGGSRGMR